jgi:tetratricopeptide (TPR) repeat protein
MSGPPPAPNGSIRRERVPLEWAMTQSNLGNALLTLGERENGTSHLEEAIAVYRAALEERRRERVPLKWAMTQNNLGNALLTLGERETGTSHLEEAVAAYRTAFGGAEARACAAAMGRDTEQPRLGDSNAGGRESGTSHLEEAIAAYRAALEEYRRERAPLEWAMTQNNLGNALLTLGEREGWHIPFERGDSSLSRSLGRV